MSYVEVFNRGGIGRRLRRTTQSGTVGLHKLNHWLFSSLVQNGAEIGGAYLPPTLAPVTGLPVTGDAGGTVGATMIIDFHGMTIPLGGKTATVTYNIGSGNETVAAVLAHGDTPGQQTTKIAAAIDGVAGLSAVEWLGVDIIVTPGDGVTLSVLTLAVS